MKVNLEESWKKVLKEEFKKEYMIKLCSFLQTQLDEGHIIYPHEKQLFHAFERTPFHQTKVVILGQDPYHGANQAHGLSFSVPKGIKIPPSLQNIFKELQVEYKDFQIPTHGNLSQWADQGVLLLNATLTVEAAMAGFHQNQGWEQFTDKVIQTLSKHRNGIIFLLWGKFAQAKAELINSGKHFVLTTAHPSPLSAHKGFFGCGHFIKTNELLEQNGEKGIDWRINE